MFFYPTSRHYSSSLEILKFPIIISIILIIIIIIALSYGLNDRGFEFRQRLGIFLLTTASRPALEPTQIPVQGVTGALSWG
jgi:hypothetical protein